jgi:hypothetical protein
MALTQVTGPYPIFTDLDGTPLDDGYLYIGAINEDPEQNPIQVFWDSNLTIPATQPIRTSNGYAYRNGTPALIYTAGQFSITIRNKREEFVLYSPVGYGFDPGAVSAAVVQNDFIGDGVEVNFTLSSAPSTKLATNVYINGVYQEKDSYSLSGNVITLSIAPPLNSSIEIITSETGVINSGNAGAISYTLTQAGAVGQTVQTKLDQYISVKDYGAVGDGVADDTLAIQAMIDSVGYFRLPLGTYKITDTLTIPNQVSLLSIGALFSGEGMEKSVINCVGMVGKPAIKNAAAGLYRVVMQDFGINGNCDNAINFDLTALVYQSNFENLVLSSGAGSCFVCRDHFSSAWNNVHVSSLGGHGFDLEGGNSTTLSNCYAHTFTLGNGKAGYRIRNNAVLISCNGVDSGDVWGIFGDTIGYETGSINFQFEIRLIGCNIEDFDVYAVGLLFTGRFEMIGTTFTAKAAGTYETLIKGNVTAPITNWQFIERGTRSQSKGSTRSGASSVLCGNPSLFDSAAGAFPDYFNNTVSLLYAAPSMSMSGPAFQTSATKFVNLDADRYYGFTQQPPTTWTANATTFAVTRKNVVKTANTVATAFLTATGGTEGHELTLIVRDGNTTVNHGTSTNQFNLIGGVNLVCADRDVLQFVYNGVGWKQV